MGVQQQPINKHRCERDLERWAASHHGVFTRAKAIELGVGPGVVRDRLETGRWLTLHRAVYSLAGTPRSWGRDLVAACLAGGDGACASHRAAGKLWSLPFQDQIVEISSSRQVTVKDAVVHRVKTLPRCDLTEINGIPVTQPTRTVIDLAGFLDAGTVEHILDDALRRRLTTIPRLE